MFIKMNSKFMNSIVVIMVQVNYEGILFIGNSIISKQLCAVRLGLQTPKPEIGVIYYTRYPTEQMNSNESKCNYSDKTKASKLSFTKLSVEALRA